MSRIAHLRVFSSFVFELNIPVFIFAFFIFIIAYPAVEGLVKER